MNDEQRVTDDTEGLADDLFYNKRTDRWESASEFCTECGAELSAGHYRICSQYEE